MSANPTTPDLDTTDLDEFLRHPHWEALDGDLDRLVQQLPLQAENCERTTILSWIYLLKGVTTFVDLAERITGIENITLRKRTLRRTLRTMEHTRLLTVVNFPDEEDEPVESGEDVIGRNSIISLTWLGMVWMRRAWAARAKLARTSSVLTAHRTLTDEEDEGKGNDPYWVDNLSGYDVESVKFNIRAAQAGRGAISSVFDLALPRKK